MSEEGKTGRDQHGYVKIILYRCSGVLRKLWQDNEEVFNTIVLPKILIDPVLQLANDSAGHNWFQWVYLSIRQLYYWNNMKKDILHHCKHCAVCKKFKTE